MALKLLKRTMRERWRKMNKRVIVKCSSNSVLPLEKLVLFQGELKKLPKKNYNKLRKSIEKLGFIAPIFVWDNNGEYKLLDGTQRTTVLKQMQTEGWEIPELPVDFIQADTEEDAKDKLLHITSQYGKFDIDGYMDFVGNMEIDESVILTNGEWKKPESDIVDEEEDDIRDPFGDERDTMPMAELLNQYDTICASFSGGKDSVAMALALKDMGLQNKTTLIYCHVPVFAFEDEQEYTEYIAKELGFKLEVLEPKETKDDIYDKLKRRGYPGRLLNWCNSDFKVKPMNDFYKTLDDKNYIMVMGTRAEESPRRAEMRSRGVWNKRDFAYPIFDMKQTEVIKIINEQELAMHHAYEHFGRMSCSICYQQTKGKWQLLQKYYPEEYQKALMCFSYGMESVKFRKCDYSNQLLGNMVREPKDNDVDYSLPFDKIWENGKIKNA